MFKQLSYTGNSEIREVAWNYGGEQFELFILICEVERAFGITNSQGLMYEERFFFKSGANAVNNASCSFNKEYKKLIYWGRDICSYKLLNQRIRNGWDIYRKGFNE